MAIQYAGGTNINNQLTAALGTKQELASWIQDELVAAGWTLISGSHSATIVVESAATPASLQMRLTILTSATNCVTLRGSNVGGTKAAAVGQFLLPGIGTNYRILCNKYQYFIATDGNGISRGVAAGGVIYTPSFTGITEAIWTVGNAQSDTDTSVGISWKAALQLNNNAGTGSNNTQQSIWVTINGTQWESAAGVSAGAFGMLNIMVPFSGFLGYAGGSSVGYRWFDNSAFITEPLLLVGAGLSLEGKIIGQLWDAAIITDSIAAETSLTFDSHNWLVWTDTSPGSAGISQRGALVIVVP